MLSGYGFCTGKKSAIITRAYDIPVPNPMPVQPADLVNAALAYRNVPFLHAGRNKVGLDCLGLILCSAKDCGWLTDFRYENYGVVVNPDLIYEQIEQFCNLRAEGVPAEIGDILLFKVIGNPQHFGILTEIDADGQTFFIHADQSAGKVQVSRLAGRWLKRLFLVYRPKYEELNARYLPEEDH
jgi:cell wall-associated NlpC family hydrolase